MIISSHPPCPPRTCVVTEAAQLRFLHCNVFRIKATDSEEILQNPTWSQPACSVPLHRYPNLQHQRASWYVPVSLYFWEKRKVLKSLQRGEAQNQRAVMNLLAGRLRWIKGFLRPKAVGSRGGDQFILSLEVPLAIQLLSPGDSGSPPTV